MSSTDSEVSFWCLPLTNFVVSFNSPQTDLFNDHPLRVVPVNREDQPLTDLNFYHHVEGGLIEFVYRGLPAFIQPALHYGDIVDELQRRNAHSAVTAHIIGPIPLSVSRDKVDDYVPFDVLRLLSIASGHDVGSTGLEIYDFNGDFRGWHKTNDFSSYFSAHEQVHELGDRGIGYLLTVGLQSDFFTSAPFRVASRMFIRSGDSHLVVEERLSLLFRAIECLCDHFEFPSAIKTVSVTTEAEMKILKQIADDTRKRIRQVARESESPLSREHLLELASKISHKSAIPQSFGKRLAQLMVRSGLQDLEVLDGLTFDLGPSTAKNWVEMVTYYRNLVMHSGYIAQEQYPSIWDPAYTILDHLHDIVLRILLKLLGFTKTYQPSTIKMTANFVLDWVTPGIGLGMLGYGQIAPQS